MTSSVHEIVKLSIGVPYFAAEFPDSAQLARLLFAQRDCHTFDLLRSLSDEVSCGLVAYLQAATWKANATISLK
jgi:hypothetical protein